MARNRELEFSYATKIEALERSGYRCDHCGKEEGRGDARLEAHHRLALWFAKEYPVFAPALITHLCNCEILCVSCHKNVHKKESRSYYAELAPVVLQEYLQATLDTSKDDWRTQLRRAYANTR